MIVQLANHCPSSIFLVVQYNYPAIGQEAQAVGIMGTKRRRDALATNVLPAETTQKLNRLIVSALRTLELPVDAFESAGNLQDVVSDRIHSLGLIKLKQVPKLQPPGSVYSSDLALRLFYSCRKAEVVTMHTKTASYKSEISKKSEISTVDDPQKLANLCLDALNLELSRRPYRYIVRVRLPDKVDIALGALPDRILVQIREFAECKNSDAVDAALRSHLPLKILFQDDALIVVEKLADVLSVDGTDSNALPSVHRCIANVYPEARMVHRLDQETSGLLVFALTKSAAHSLNAQFRADRSRRFTWHDGWTDDGQSKGGD